jgi:hypothetical protein
MVEKRRNSTYRVKLYSNRVVHHDIVIDNIPTRELAEDIDRQLTEAYRRGALNPVDRWRDTDD